ncbi:hypothetical protein BGZ76_009378 [Entomortierella beljakovae]|nr:hypothetical protein BGZ76_009378 [Entomortierella beljakovae]
MEMTTVDNSLDQNSMEKATESLLPIPKRSFDTETDHTDKNDVNEMAPTSAILETKLGMVDRHRLDMEIDIQVKENSVSPNGRAQKRARNSRDELTSSDLTQLKSIILPEVEYNTSRPVTRSISRRRTMADLVHPSTSCPPINMDEPEATAVYGEPVDSSSSSLALYTTEDARPTSQALSVKYPGSSQAGSESLRYHKTLSGSVFLTTITKYVSIPGLEHKNENDNSHYLTDVRIQILDEAESERIRQVDQHTLTSNPPSLSSSDTNNMLVDENQGTEVDSDDIRDDDQNIVLPIEDPAVHDWDVEEIEDEESVGTSTLPLPTYDSPNLMSQADAMNEDTNGSAPSHRDDDDNESEEGNDEEWNPQLDPEREVTSMSEDQELDLHNVHMRLETQRGFQDSSSLDLGELDGFVRSEDGRYGGAIEADDEGEDFWENR